MSDEDRSRGLYQKFHVVRRRDEEGKHDGCEYFVIDMVHDRHGVAALRAYARSCQAEYPALASDLLVKADEMDTLFQRRT